MRCRTGTCAPTRPLLSQALCKAWGTGRDERVPAPWQKCKWQYWSPSYAINL